jgi:glycosyltransferase involved in cell wall biosynthesis
MAGERQARVLLTADTVGGVWSYAVELSRALVRRNVEVHLATMGAPLAPHQREQLQGTGAALHESSWRLEWMQDPWQDVERAGQWLLALEAQLRPDVVHLNQFAFGALPFRAPTLLVAHSCVVSWWQAVHGCAPDAQWDAYRRCVGRGLAGASLVAAPSRAMLRTLAVNYGAAADGLVLPNGRDPQSFTPAAKEPFILAAGRLWDQAKNLAALDAASEGLPWPVLMAGSCRSPDGSVRQPRVAQALGELTAPELAALMGRAAIYALPARYEPFGLSILEAALSGCALVLGEIDSLRETWDGFARFTPPGDAAALRQVLQELMADSAERERLGAAARARALDFNPARMAQATLQAYEQLQPRLAPMTTEELTCA